MDRSPTKTRLNDCARFNDKINVLKEEREAGRDFGVVPPALSERRNEENKTLVKRCKKAPAENSVILDQGLFTDRGF